MSADLLSRNPTTDISSCASAVSGHAAEQDDELAASDESCHLIPPAGRLRPNDSTVEPHRGVLGALPVSVYPAYLAPHAAGSAYTAGRVRSALPTDESAEAALRRAMAARN